jgi:hypothetical protein
MPRERVAIPFGEGLDRATGRMLVRPGSIRDLRNVYLKDGRVIVRAGHTAIAQFTDEGGTPISNIIGGHAERTEHTVIIIGYQATGTYAGRVYIYRADADGTDPLRLSVTENGTTRGYLWDVDSAAGRPKVILTDTYGKIFIAHDEPVPARRQQTYYYDAFGTSAVVPLTATWATNQAVHFRGVARWLDYLLGWGADDNHAEYVRVSKPGEPTEFEVNSYWIIGQRNEPVLNVIDGVVLKATELWKLTGYSKENFGRRPLDMRNGVAASQLAMEWQGGVLFWSAKGPRWTDGEGASIDLALPLDLLGFEPSDLVARGVTDYGLVAANEQRDIATFIFGRRGYALSNETPGKPKWSYVEFPWEVDSAFRLFPAVLDAPTGWPTFFPVVDWQAVSDFYATPKIQYHNADGDEILEVWLKPAAGAWALYRQLDILDNAPSEFVRVGNPYLPLLIANTLYDAAVRFRRGGQYTDGYKGVTPAEWANGVAGNTVDPDPDSFIQFTTTNTQRSGLTAVWSRLDAANEQFLVSWDGGPNVATEVWQRISNDGGVTYGAWAQATGSPVLAGIEQLAVNVNGNGEKYHQFYVTPAGGAASPYITEWSGPYRPRGLKPGFNPSADSSYADGNAPFVQRNPIENPFDPLDPGWTPTTEDVLLIIWRNAAQYTDLTHPNVDTEVWIDDLTGHAAVPPYDYFLAGTETEWAEQWDVAQVPMIGNYSNTPPLTGEVPSTGADVKLRHKWTQFGIDDFSDFTPVGNA